MSAMEPESPLNGPRAGVLLDQALSGNDHRLDIAALAVACLEYPELALDETLARLDNLASRVRGSLPIAEDGSYSPTDAAYALSQVLAHEEGFGGDRELLNFPEGSFPTGCSIRKWVCRSPSPWSIWKWRAERGSRCMGWGCRATSWWGLARARTESPSTPFMEALCSPNRVAGG